LGNYIFMNWYKESKLIDIDPPQSMTLHCMYCNRWATTEQENALKGNAVWKKEQDLTHEEKQDVRDTRGKKSYSSGICPTCHKIVMDFLHKDIHDFSPETIKSISLLLP